MRFANPQLLWLLAVTLALFTAFAVWAVRRQRVLRQHFIQARLLPQLTVGLSPRRDALRWTLLAVAVTGILLALARPQWGFDWDIAKQKGLDIVVAIDTSRSMLAEDVRPNRLARAKLAALDLLKVAQTDRLGLVAFAGSAFLQCPLTVDDVAFRQSVEALDTSIIPQGGTALASAIQVALDAFKDENNFKILVILTDGEDHDSGAASAAALAAKAGMRIFTVGVGTPNGEILRVTDDKGALTYIKDEQGKVVRSQLNEALLREIAQATAGAYLPLQSAHAIESLYAQGLAPLPKAERDARQIQRYHERFAWPLGVAILLLAIEFLLPDRRRDASPATAPPPSRARPPAARLAALLACSAALQLQASPGTAQNHFEAGRFLKAEEEYRRLVERNPDDPRLQFNLGATTYRNQKFEDAARAFTNALSSPDVVLQQKALYNLGDALYRLGEDATAFNIKTQQWHGAVRSFEGALQLDPNDADAKHNRDFVQKKLEELIQQQQEQDQQKNQQQDQQDKSDDSKDSSQRNQDQNDSEQQKQQDQPNAQDQGQTNAPPQQSQPQDRQEPKDTPQQQQDQAQKEQKEPGQSPKPQDATQGSPGESQQSPAEATPLGQMTPQQAEQLLDAQKDEERVLIFAPQKRSESAPRRFRDW